MVVSSVKVETEVAVSGKEIPKTLFDQHTLPLYCYCFKDKVNQRSTLVRESKCVTVRRDRDTVDFINRNNRLVNAAKCQGHINMKEMQFLVKLNNMYSNKLLLGGNNKMFTPICENRSYRLYNVTHLCGSLIEELKENNIFYTYDPFIQMLTIHLDRSQKKEEEEDEEEEDSVVENESTISSSNVVPRGITYSEKTYKTRMVLGLHETCVKNGYRRPAPYYTF